MLPQVQYRVGLFCEKEIEIIIASTIQSEKNMKKYVMIKSVYYWSYYLDFNTI